MASFVETGGAWSSALYSGITPVMGTNKVLSLLIIGVPLPFVNRVSHSQARCALCCLTRAGKSAMRRGCS